MGQPITISGTTVDGPVAAFHTDRSITGQDGVSYASIDAAAAADSFPGDLATRLFGDDESIDHVFIASNQVVARRDQGWDEGSLRAARTIVEEFFVHYADAVS
jgi:hypothetical protein